MSSLYLGLTSEWSLLDISLIHENKTKNKELRF